MDNFFHNTPNVPIALCIVKWTEFGRGLVVVGVGLELKCTLENVRACDGTRTIAWERLCALMTRPIVYLQRLSE